MTLYAATPKRFRALDRVTQDRHAPQLLRTGTPQPKSHYNIAALRKDGSLLIAEDRVPSIDLFESAFSAFARGTVIQTETGDRAIEDLQPGDMIQTSTGEAAKLLWIGSSTFNQNVQEKRTKLIRVMADTFGQGRPSMFLTLGASARVLHTPDHLRGGDRNARLLTPISTFVDGVNVIEVTPPTSITLFHLCLSRHAAIKAGGIEVETFHPGSQAPKRVSHTIRARFLSLFPHIDQFSDFGPLAHPRAPEIWPAEAH